MSKVKIVMNRDGMNELLHSAEIESALMGAANKVQGRAGSNFGAFAVKMPSRSIVRVSALNRDGMKENSDNNVLVKSLYGGG